MSSDSTALIGALIEKYHDRFSAGDIESVLNLWDDEGSVFEPGNATAKGKAQLRAAYERGYAGAEYYFASEIEEIVASDGLGSVLATATGRVTVKATGDVVPVTARQIFTVRRTTGEWRLLYYMFQEAPSG